MDRSNDRSEVFLHVSSVEIGSRSRSKSRARRAPTKRMTFFREELSLLGDFLFDRTSGVRLARFVPRLALDAVERLTITSTTIDVSGDHVVTCCSGPCGRQFALADMGLRNMGAGSLRNQPQCPECRGRYRERASASRANRKRP